MTNRDSARASAEPRPANWTGYSTMAEHVRPAAGTLVDLLGPPNGTLVDIGTGSGNVLQSARAAGWHAIGLDLSPDQLETAATGHRSLLRADASHLPIGAASVAAVCSNFGLIFADEPTDVLHEVSSALVTGGRLAFTAWTPGGWPDDLRQALAAHAGVRPAPFPTTLGQPEAATTATTSAGLRLEHIEQHSLRWRFGDEIEAINRLTTAAAGLRDLRQRLERRRQWNDARETAITALRSHLIVDNNDVTICDQYLAVVAVKS